MLDNKSFISLQLKDAPHDIHIYCVSNKIIEKNHRENFNLLENRCFKMQKKSFLRSRLLINKLKLDKKKFISISHSDHISIISVSDTFKLGVDLEKSSRRLTKRLSSKLLINNAHLGLLPIQIWTLMEATFKCLNCKGEHFLEYIFIKKDNKYVPQNVDKKMTLISSNYGKYTVGLAFTLES